MRAAVVDLVIESATDFAQAFALWSPAGTPVPVETIAIGDRIFADGLPELVAAIEPFAGGRRLIFGTGQWHDGYMSLYDGTPVMPAVPMPVLAAQAGYGQRGTPKMFTATIRQNTVVISLSNVETQALYIAPGGPWPWDLYVQTAGGWIRLCEGTVSTIEGETKSLAPVPIGAVR